MGAYLGFDTTKGDDEQFFSEEDNQTYRDYFMETALKSAQRAGAWRTARKDRCFDAAFSPWMRSWYIPFSRARERNPPEASLR